MMNNNPNYLELRSGHQQRDILVRLAGQQHHSILPVLDLNTIDLGGQKEILYLIPIYNTLSFQNKMNFVLFKCFHLCLIYL